MLKVQLSCQDIERLGLKPFKSFECMETAREYVRTLINKARVDKFLSEEDRGKLVKHAIRIEESIKKKTSKEK